MHTTSPSLMERLRRPDDGDAWTRFARLYTRALYFRGRRGGLAGAGAADLVQEVLIAMVPKLPAFRYGPAQSFRGWLRTVPLNKWREQARHRNPAAPGPDTPA